MRPFLLTTRVIGFHYRSSILENMKSIFNSADQHEILERIDTLTADNKPTWGKMTVGQMVKHCILCDEYYFGGVSVKRSFLGRIVGQVALKDVLKPGNTIMRKNAQTGSGFLVTEAVTDLENQKKNWKAMIERYKQYPNDHFHHWFFGKMTKEQLGRLVYIHCNHHLTQFNA